MLAPWIAHHLQPLSVASQGPIHNSKHGHNNICSGPSNISWMRLQEQNVHRRISTCLYANENYSDDLFTPPLFHSFPPAGCDSVCGVMVICGAVTVRSPSCVRAHGELFSLLCSLLDWNSGRFHVVFHFDSLQLCPHDVLRLLHLALIAAATITGKPGS